MASSSSSSIPPQQTSNSDTITNNSNSNSNSTSRSASASASIHIPQSHHPHHYESSTPTPVVAVADGSARSTQGHTQPHSNSNSHEQHFYQHQHHSRSHSATIPLGGMPASAPPHSSTSSMGQMSSPGSLGVASIPGTSYYYHPYTIFPPPPPPHSHSHHGPPPPHPPAPPAPPRANRANPSQLHDSVLHHQRASTEASPSPFLSYASTPSSMSIQDASNNERMSGPAGRPRGPSTSASPSLRGASPSSLSILTSTPVLQPSSALSPSPHMSSRPQLHPTFSYYRSQADYDKQHGLFQRGGNQIHPSNNVVADTMSDQIRAGRSPSTFSSSAPNDNDQQDLDNDIDNDNDIGVEDYDGDMSAVVMHTHTALDLPIDPSILPSANSNVPTAAPSSSSSNNNYIPPGSEKRPNHEYYPSPHHQVQFREFMVANNSTHLPDPPISLNSLVDSEPGKKPAYPLPTIIRCAILGSPHERLTLSELYLAMERRFSYYTLGDGKSWRNSVRHNLSLNNLFEKVARPITEPGKGCYWIVAHDKPPGNKRERKRNKKPGKKALAAMEREKEAAAAASVEAQPHAASVGSGRQTDDEDEGDDAGEDEDDIDDSRVDQDQTITLNSSTMARRRYTASGSSTSAATTSNVAAFSPYMTTATPVLAPTTTTAIRPPFGNAYSRGTVAPNEGSYAAVTGIIPMLSQIPLPPASFGIGMASSASGVGYGANPSPNPNEGPFSAYAPQNESGGNPGFNRNNAALMGFDNTRAQTSTDMNIGSASSPSAMSMWATSNRAGESATGVATASSRRKRKATPARKNESLTVVREQHPGTGMMSQHAGAIIQNQESGSRLGPSIMRTPSQESGASTMSSSLTFTQATSMQSSASSQPHTSQGRMVSASTTPFTGSASPSPAALGRASLTLGPAQAQPLSAQSSFGSVGFSIPESVATTSSGGSGAETSASTTSQLVNTQRGTTNQSLGPHRTTRQNPTRRFDPAVPASITSSSSIGIQPYNSTQNNTDININRPRDTFNTLAAQIASEFPQTRTTSTSSDSPANFGGSVDSTTGSATVSTRATRKRPQPRPLNGLRSSKKQLRRGGDSQSEGSEEEDEGSEDDEDEDEYVPSGSAKRRGRRR